jgi:diphosphomevalonate decarboxylase
MGKQPQNIPENPSLSLTLQTLGTLVTVGESSEPLPESPFKWIPYSFVPGSVAQQKMRKHFERVAHGLQLQPPKYDVETQLRSYNNFPSDAGIASSASSFAALTLVFARLCFRATNEDAQLGDERFLKLWNDERIEGQHLRQTLSRLSREGSGSSIRSWSGPWVEWSDQDFKKVSPEFPQLIDHIVIVSDQIKAVGSSEAHQRVKTSPFWSGRPLRAQGRLIALKRLMQSYGEVQKKAQNTAQKQLLFSEIQALVWDEFQDMHQLFETAQEPFSYRTERSFELLTWLESQTQTQTQPNIKKPWIVTMDAGPNIHVLTLAEDSAEFRSAITQKFLEVQLLVDRVSDSLLDSQCGVRWI